MLKQIRRYSKFGFVLLLPAYFAILANSVMNRHTHILPNGIMVTHAHPLEGNAAGDKQTNHHHSKKEYIFLQSFCISFYIVSETFYEFCSYLNFSEVEPALPDSISQDIFFSDNLLRGPPVIPEKLIA